MIIGLKRLRSLASAFVSYLTRQATGIEFRTDACSSDNKTYSFYVTLLVNNDGFYSKPSWL